MSEVTTLSSGGRLLGSTQGAARQASHDSARQPAPVQVRNEGGKVSPPSLPFPQEAPSTRPERAQGDRSDQVEAAVSRMNEYIQNTQRDLRFSIDEDSGETVVKVLDRQTEEVIRQIPDEVFLELARSLNDNGPVHFFSEQA